MTTTERYELETRKRHLRLQAFDRAFIIPRCLGPGKVVDDPESEPAIRVAYKKLLARLGAEITAARLTERGVESLLNCLTRDLLPGSYLSKVRKVGT